MTMRIYKNLVKYCYNLEKKFNLFYFKKKFQKYLPHSY